MRHCKKEIFLYRYKNIDLYIRGIKDFLKGPAYFAALNAEALHKEIMAAGYKAVPVSECSICFDLDLFQKSLGLPKPKNRVEKLKRLLYTKSVRIKAALSLNGILLPARGTAIVSASLAQPEMCYRKKKVMHYFISGEKAFETQKSLFKTLSSFLKLGALFIQLDFCLSRAQKKWRKEGLQFRTLQYWEQYLGI